MLYQVGQIQFSVAPLNAHSATKESNTDYVEKPVVGARQPLEWVGEGAKVLSLFGRLFPKQFGGLDGLATLQAMRESGKPQYVMRGDMTPLGWFVIENIAERASYLDKDGVGRIVEFDINMKRDSTPGPESGVFTLWT